MPDSINWLPLDILAEGIRTSREMYNFIERDFVTMTEYITLDKVHFEVYSPRIGNIILRVGPEIFRVFDLIIFNKNNDRVFNEHPDVKKRIEVLQNKKNERRDSFISYVKTLPLLSAQKVQVRNIREIIYPFQIEKDKEEREYVEWWENGYNALRHRTLRNFKESATLKNVLYSLAGLFVLHEELDRYAGFVKRRQSMIFRYVS